MYFPYLRGKQFELLALRDFATGNHSKEKVVPIIEPVKQQFGGLNTAISTMLDSGLQFAMILNPKDGDFKHPNVKSLQIKTPIVFLFEKIIGFYTLTPFSSRLIPSVS